MALHDLYEPSLGALLRFAAYARQPEPRMDLAEGALLIAMLGHPDLPQRHYHRRLELLARAVRLELGSEEELLRIKRVGRRAFAGHVLAAMRLVLAEREGFHGNTEQYSVPENSFLDVVLDSGQGLPITLSVIYLEVARRLGVPLCGVGLPAHFMVKWPLPPEEGGDLFVDVFHGAELLDADDCRRVVQRALGVGAAPLRFDPTWMEPVGTRDILTRMLRNLKASYLHRGETALALETVDRLVLLRPDLPEELRDRGLLRLALGDVLLAAADIAAYAERAPDAPEVGRLRRRISGLREVRARLN